MFSSTTIASSTTNPVEIASAISDRLSRLNPSRYMPPKVPTSESGTAMLGIIVARTVRKNANTTRMTRMTETSSVVSMSLTEARTVTVRSIAIVRSIAGEIEDCRNGIRARTRSTVSIMFAPGCRNTMMRTPGLPFARPMLRRSETESMTSPTSPKRTAAPLW